ncbi:MAG: hypothetical protein WCZ72_09450 [Gemmobacter sp.]
MAATFDNGENPFAAKNGAGFLIGTRSTRGKRGAVWRTLANGEQVVGTFAVRGVLLTVTFNGKSKTTQLGEWKDAPGLAEMLMRELIAEAA